MLKCFWDDRSKDLSVVGCMMVKAFTPLKTDNGKFRVSWNFCRENVINFCLLLHERQKNAILWRWLDQYVWLGNNRTARISAFTSFQFRPCAICFYYYYYYFTKQITSDWMGVWDFIDNNKMYSFMLRRWKRSSKEIPFQVNLDDYFSEHGNITSYLERYKQFVIATDTECDPETEAKHKSVRFSAFVPRITSEKSFDLIMNLLTVKHYVIGEGCRFHNIKHRQESVSAIF